MIKINLLNSYSQSSEAAAGGDSAGSSSQSVGIEVAKRLLIVLIGPLAIYFYEMQTLPEIQGRLTQANQNLNDISQFNESKKTLANDIKKYETDMARFRAQMDFINKVSADKVNEFLLFTHIKNSTPEGVWIKKLDVNNNIITIVAESDNQSDVSDYQKRLADAAFISDLNIVNQVKKSNFLNTGTVTTEFTVKAQLSKVSDNL